MAVRSAESYVTANRANNGQTPTIEPAKTAEAMRLEAAREKGVSWRQWGPYLSERQWGTVRKDYISTRRWKC